MAAVAFKALLNFVGSDGQPFTYFCTVTDVNAGYYITPDANTDLVLPTNHGAVVYLRDVILAPAGGTDTTTASIYVNGKDTGEKVVNGANLGTNLTRQFQQKPMGILAGARVKFIQNT